MTSPRINREKREDHPDLDHSFAILDRAAINHKPVEFFALFSGGHDSLTATAIAFKWAEHRGVDMTAAHIDTTIGIPETQQFVRDTCREHRWPLRIEKAEKSYRELVLEFGFPGPGMHGLMFQRLKERALRKLVRESKGKWKDRVMFVSGARLQESKRRRKNFGLQAEMQAVEREGAKVWAAPVLEWSAVDCARFIKHEGLKRNPVKDRIEMSGECGCFAYGSPDQVREWEFWYPDFVAGVRELEAEVQAKGFRACRWGHGGSLLNVHPDQTKLFDADATNAPSLRQLRAWRGQDPETGEQLEAGRLCQSCELREAA